MTLFTRPVPARRVLMAGVLVAGLLIATASSSARTEATTGAGEHESWLPTIARVVNFAALVGVLVYFFRSPIATYLSTRADSIRRGLVDANTIRDAAAAELRVIEQRVAGLPAELETLRRRGEEELQSEAHRLQEASHRERERLLDRARKEIDRELRLARRTLTEHAADLTARLARQRLERAITPDDQVRLVERYAADVRS